MESAHCAIGLDQRDGDRFFSFLNYYLEECSPFQDVLVSEMDQQLANNEVEDNTVEVLQFQSVSETACDLQPHTVELNSTPLDVEPLQDTSELAVQSNNAKGTAEDIASHESKRSRKRKLQTSQWKRTKAKLARMRGQAYVSGKGEHVAEKLAPLSATLCTHKTVDLSAATFLTMRE